MIILLNVRRLDIRNKFQRYICPCKGVHLSWTRAQNAKQMFFCWKYICPSKRLQPHMFSFTNQKRWLEEAEAQVSKNKFQGAGPFLAEYMRMIFKGWPHRKKVASPGQPPIDRKWWDKNSIIVCQRTPKTLVFCWTYICPWKSLQPHMFSFTNQKGDLKRPRRRCQK